MADYNIVKNCYICKKRFVVDNSQSKKNYCKTCQKRVDRERAEMIKESKKEKK